MKLSGAMSKKLTKDFFEHEAWGQNKLVCGIDEAGRGPLVGPVVVAAAVLPINTTYKLLKDSKVLTEVEREQAFTWIVKHAIYSVVVVNHHDIDCLNIYQATKRAMHKAYVQIIEQLQSVELLHSVLVDAMPLEIAPGYKHDKLEVHSFPFAESKSKSVAAASIIAKVTRDRLMVRLNSSFPLYNFQQHKGYGTPAHDVSIRLHGPSIIHRNSFISKYLNEVKSHDEQQNTLF